MTQYEYPIALESELESVELQNGLVLRRMDEPTRERLLKVSNVQFDDDGRVKSYNWKGDLNHILSPDLDRTVTFYASNFVLTTSKTELAADFNFALKLLGRSWSSLFIGYELAGGGVAFCAPPCYFGKTRQKLDDETVPDLLAILKALSERTGDSKLRLMRDIWMYAMSDEPRSTTRFVEVSTLLEMLLLPKQSTELGFRFALRLAKLGVRLGYVDPVDTFEKAKTLYSVRSKLVHSGSDDRLHDYEELAYEFARRLLTQYLFSPSDFAEGALDRLCIAA